MDKVTLQAAARNMDVTPRQIRMDGNVPCVVYGNEVEHAELQCEINAITKAFMKAGESTLVELDANGKKIPVLFHAIDFDPVSDRIRHVDFYAVNMKKEVEAEVPVHLEGESLAIKEMGAILVNALHHVEVRCLPANLPHALVVDLALLNEMGATIHVKDIKVPDGVTIVTDAEAVIAVAQEPRAEEVAVAAPAEGAAAAAEGAEGAAPAEGEAEKKEEK